MLVAVSGVLPPALTGALAVQLQDDLAIPDGFVGLSISVFFAVSVVAAATLGRRVDALGWRRAAILTAVTSGACLLAVALWARDGITLVLTLAIGGVGVSLAMLTSNLILAREMPRRRLGLTVGIKQAAVPGASLFAGIAVPAIGLTIGWRWAFAIAAVCPVLATILALRRGKAAAPLAPITAAPRGVVTPELIGLAAAAALASLVPGALTAYFVLSAVDAGIDPGAAGVALAVASGAGLLTRIAAGWWADNADSAGFVPAAAMLALAAAGLGLLATREPWLVVAGVVVSHGIGGSWGGLYFYGLVRASIHAPTTATGAVQAGGSTGVLAGPLLFAMLARVGGHALAWWVLAALGMLAAAIIVTVGGRYVRSSPGSSTSSPSSRAAASQ